MLFCDVIIKNKNSIDYAIIIKEVMNMEKIKETLKNTQPYML